MVRDVVVDGGRVSVVIALTVPGCRSARASRSRSSRRSCSLDGVDEVELGFDVMSPTRRSALTSRLRGGVSERTPGISVDSGTRVSPSRAGKAASASRRSPRTSLPFSGLGHRTGVLDADVYGYSIPQMLGVHQRPVAVDGGERAMIVLPCAAISR